MKNRLEWEVWGRTDPLWAVATLDDRRRQDSQAWTDTDFYADGAQEIPSLLRRWEHYGVDKSSCLEIGCGAGRLTMHLASHFGEVHGVDIAPGMIDFAKGHVQLPGVHFYVTDGITLPLPSAYVTAVFSTYVFQHFDGFQDAAACLREANRVLAPGGSMFIQLPLFTWPELTRLFGAILAGKRALQAARAAYKRSRLARGKGPAFMRNVRYETEELRRLLTQMGLIDIEFHLVEVTREEPLFTAMLCRKPAR